MRYQTCFLVLDALPGRFPLYCSSQKLGLGQSQNNTQGPRLNYTSQRAGAFSLITAIFSLPWLFRKHLCGRTRQWGITLLGLFSPWKGSQELTLPKTDSRGYLVRNQWSRTSRSPSTRAPSVDESRSKNTSLKVEMGMKGKSTCQNNNNNNID